MSTAAQLECERLMDAILEEVADRDQRGTEVEAALKRIGLVGGDWLAELGGREACLFAAYEQLTERLGSRVRRECERGGPWTDRVRRCLMAMLEGLAAQPWTAQVLTHSFPSLGPEAQARYEGFVEGFSGLLSEGREVAKATGELPAEVEVLAAGAAEAIIFEEVEAGRAEQLPELGPQILYSLLVPFLGPEEAAAEMRRASEPGRGEREIA